MKDQPEITWAAEQGAFYTLMMFDPDAPSPQNQTWSEVRHQLVMNIPESAVYKGDAVAEYRGSAPPIDTGFHRYIFLEYKQPNGMITNTEPRTLKMVIHIDTSNKLMKLVQNR